MPRSSSRSSSSSRGAAPARHSSHAAPAPARAAPAAAAPPPAVARPAEQGQSFIGTMVSGLAFGTGSAIAHRAVGAVAGAFGGGAPAAGEPASAATAAPAAPVDECASFKQEYKACLQTSSFCDVQLDRLTQCRSAMA